MPRESQNVEKMYLNGIFNGMPRYNKSLKINLRKNIGTVLLVVEGSSYEFRIFKYVFQNILGYRYVQRSRNQKGFKVYDEFIMRGNENSRVIVINASNSNIGLLDKDEIIWMKCKNFV